MIIHQSQTKQNHISNNISNINSSSLNVTHQSSYVICSKADEIKFLKEQEERNRIERIKQVRN